MEDAIARYYEALETTATFLAGHGFEFGETVLVNGAFVADIVETPMLFGNVSVDMPADEYQKFNPDNESVVKVRSWRVLVGIHHISKINP